QADSRRVQADREGGVRLHKKTGGQALRPVRSSPAGVRVGFRTPLATRPGAPWLPGGQTKRTRLRGGFVAARANDGCGRQRLRLPCLSPSARLAPTARAIAVLLVESDRPRLTLS